MAIADSSFGEVIRKLRRHSQLTQRELAQALGVDPTYLSHLESGRRDPSIDLLRRMAVELKIPFPLFLATILAADIPDHDREPYDRILRRLWRLAAPRAFDEAP